MEALTESRDAAEQEMLWTVAWQWVTAVALLILNANLMGLARF